MASEPGTTRHSAKSCVECGPFSTANQIMSNRMERCPRRCVWERLLLVASFEWTCQSATQFTHIETVYYCGECAREIRQHDTADEMTGWRSGGGWGLLAPKQFYWWWTNDDNVDDGQGEGERDKQKASRVCVPIKSPLIEEAKILLVPLPNEVLWCTFITHTLGWAMNRVEILLR